MKFIKLTLTFIIVFTINNVFAQNLIKLPEPEKTGGKPLMQALNERSSSRDFIDKELTDQQLSNLYCASEGLISVFRAWINKEKIAKELNLPENYEAIYSQSVGYSK